MRSRALFLVAATLLAAFLIGCGGSGGDGGNNNPPPTTGGVPGATQPGDSVAMVNLPGSTSSPAGRVNVAYLPLQGRALETFTVLIPNVELGFGAETFIDTLIANIQFILNGNAVQQRSSSVPVPDGYSRFFDTFYLNISSLLYDDDPSTPGATNTFGTASDPFVQELGFPASVRVLPARETTVPIFLNDAMIQLDFPEGLPAAATFLTDVFNERNGTPIQGFISDFLVFDVSTMGNKRPLLSDGSFANRVYFSGDRFAVSGDGPIGDFELLTDELGVPKKGEFTDPPNGTVGAPGIYRTKVPDPTDPFLVNQITEIFGIFRRFVDVINPSKSMVVNTGDFEVLLMPKSADDENQQMLLIKLNGAEVTDMYWGDAHLASGSFVAYPLANLTSGSTAGSIQGTLSGFLDVSAVPVSVSLPADARRVRYGRYQITTIKPSGFDQSGRFIVFRK